MVFIINKKVHWEWSLYCFNLHNKLDVNITTFTYPFIESMAEGSSFNELTLKKKKAPI
jgi:hypothetical protein